FVENAKADKAVASKTIFGTDWWMTEMDHISPKDFWTWSGEVIDMKHPMWRQWTTENPLKYLNLEKRLPSMETWYKKANPNVLLPGWWENLKKYYAKANGG